MEFSLSFLHANLIRVMIDFFGHKKLVEFLHKNYSTILVKCVIIFYLLCKQALYSSTSDDDSEASSLERMVRILTSFRDRVERLINEEEENSLGKFKNSNYVLYLVSLAYLQVKLKNVHFLEFKHCERIARLGFISTSSIAYTEITNAFVHAEKIELEFVNERGEREKQLATRHTFINNSNSAMAYTLIDALNNINICFRTNETKRMAYEEYVYFFKSILYYGLTIEKIVCLHCLTSFCADIKVREFILSDDKLISYLNGVEVFDCENNANLRQRLRIVVIKFLELLKG